MPWDTALAVLRDVTCPVFSGQAAHALPNYDALPDDAFGALVSLTMNRGASFGTARRPDDTQDRYREMRSIKAAMKSKNFAAIPGELRSMKRLSPSSSGLQRRREDEARLFESALG